MSSFTFIARAVTLVICFFVLASCTQTSQSTFGGNLANEKLSASKKAKIIAARKRVAEKRAAEQKAFFDKRRAAFSGQRKTVRQSKPKTRKSALRKNRRTAVKSRSRSRNKTARLIKGKRKSIKQKSSAFVGGKSRGIAKNAPWRCVPRRLKKVLNQVSRKFGKVIVNSTHRSSRRNRKVGGKRRSYHLRCAAVDFRVKGRTRGLSRWLRRHPLVGGFKRYPSGFYHIDTGPKRSW